MKDILPSWKFSELAVKKSTFFRFFNSFKSSNYTIKQGTGTSASSPMAAGIIALALQANPNLSWRDVQHLVVRTSRPRKNLKIEDWRTNNANLTYSHSYG